jgi:hypothetical protein
MADVFLAIVFALFNRSEDRSQAARWFASKQHFWEIHRNPIIDVLFPLVGWLIEGFEQTPLSTGLFDDRWYTSSLSLYFDHFRTWLKVIYGICSISYMGCHPSHWRTHIFRGVGQPPTRWLPLIPWGHGAKEAARCPHRASAIRWNRAIPGECS